MKLKKNLNISKKAHTGCLKSLPAVFFLFTADFLNTLYINTFARPIRRKMLCFYTLRVCVIPFLYISIPLYYRIFLSCINLLLKGSVFSWLNINMHIAFIVWFYFIYKCKDILFISNLFFLNKLNCQCALISVSFINFFLFKNAFICIDIMPLNVLCVHLSLHNIFLCY